MEIVLEKNYVGVSLDTESALRKLECRYLARTLGTGIRYNEEKEHYVIHIGDNVLQPYSDLYDRGVKYCKEGRYGKAIEILSEVVTACPVYIDAFTILAQAYYGIGNTDKAIDNLIQALMLNPKDATANTVMGNTLMVKGQVGSAIKYYNSALETAEDKVYITENLATAYLKLEKYDKVISLCDELRWTYYVNDYFVYVTKSLALEGMGHQEEALACCIDALRWGFPDTTMTKKDLFDYVYRFCERMHSEEKDSLLVKDMENLFKNVFKVKIEYEYTGYGVGICGKYETCDKTVRITLDAERGYTNDIKIYNLKTLEGNIREAMGGNYRRFLNRGFDSFLTRFWRDSEDFLNNVSEEEQDAIRHNYHDYLFDQIIGCIDSFFVNFDLSFSSEMVHMGFVTFVRKIKAQVTEIEHMKDLEIITEEYKFIMRSLCYASILQFKDLYGYDLASTYEFEENDIMFGKLIWETFDKNHGNKGCMFALKSSLISLFSLDNIIETRYMDNRLRGIA